MRESGNSPFHRQGKERPSAPEAIQVVHDSKSNIMFPFPAGIFLKEFLGQQRGMSALHPSGSLNLTAPFVRGREDSRRDLKEAQSQRLQTHRTQDAAKGPVLGEDRERGHSQSLPTRSSLWVLGLV